MGKKIQRIWVRRPIAARPVAGPRSSKMQVRASGYAVHTLLARNALSRNNSY